MRSHQFFRDTSLASLNMAFLNITYLKTYLIENERANIFVFCVENVRFFCVLLVSSIFFIDIISPCVGSFMFVIPWYMALLNDDLYRHVGNWRKCIHDCERAEFLFISALKTYTLNVEEWKATLKELKFTLSKSRMSDQSFRVNFTLKKEWHNSLVEKSEMLTLY